jgi:hypothetical protein
MHSHAWQCHAWHGWARGERPLPVEPTGDGRAGGPDIRLPSAGLSWSVLTTSNLSVPTRSFLSGFARSFDRLPAVSPFSYVPATSQATYRLRSRLRSSQGGRLRGFDGGFGGPGSGAGNPAVAKGYGQFPYHYHSHANPMGAFSRGRARSSVLGIGSQVPGTRDGGESGNKAECPSHASKARTRGMLCQALHGYA